ncbi:MAG: HPr kinase/phosphatase C-terminal domain-containing protein [Proteobacteria bacterium]|nr:HPr kinase/phosphatase C-terminal domain-containing protein [Pseudomonadota bacterium]
MKTVHATSVAIDKMAILIRGEPGAGKSDLALRLVDEGAVLIADDYTNLFRKGRDLIASPPPRIAGQMEVRGLGVHEFPHASGLTIRLLVDLVPGEIVERLPETVWEEIDGVRILRIKIDPFEASATAKVRLAVRQKPARGMIL